MTTGTARRTGTVLLFGSGACKGSGLVSLAGWSLAA